MHALSLSSFVATAFSLAGLTLARDADPREHMYLARGAQPSPPYVGLTPRQQTTSKNGLPYPAAVAKPPSQVPQAWLDKLKTVKDAGLIPNLAVPTISGSSGMPIYPSGLASKDICNWELDGCFMDDTLNVAPDGMCLIGIDDGPTEAVTDIGKVLSKHNVSASHFLIGLQILNCPSCLTDLTKIEPKQHIGSHSFTHTQMPQWTDEELVADLGWTNQIIYDYTGEIPAYFRPPQGDIDYRVAAIAKYVFGLQTVMWNDDALDWCVQDDNKPAPGLSDCKDRTPENVVKDYLNWANAEPQKGISLLAHEIRAASAPMLDQMLTALEKKKWKIGPAPMINDKLLWYANSAGPGVGAKVSDVDNILPTGSPYYNVSQQGLKIEFISSSKSSSSSGGSGKGASAAAGNSTTSGSGSDSGSSASSTGSGSGSGSGTGTGTDSSSTSSSSPTTAGTTTSGALGRSDVASSALWGLVSMLLAVWLTCTERVFDAPVPRALRI